ncbi:FecR domain-containing protein [Chitinimonas lacunae]|uniref:FecR domain-containing protein n=1 Tax=Chitinimonas lacunae TaxID=1963018 RepID=A0ABV8MY17_9NEIS
MRRVLTTLVSSCLFSYALADGGEIVALAGRVDYREANASAWRPAVLRQQVQPASFVRTGDAASVALLLSDRTQVKLGANSMFQLRGVATGGTRLFLQRGKAWSQTKNAGGGLSMDTPAVTAGIHGTDWVMEVDERGTTRVTVLSGVVSLHNEYGRVVLNSGEEGHVEVGAAPIRRVLVTPRERVQWVGIYRIDPRSYPELDAAARLQLAEPVQLAQELARRRREQPEAPAWLLGAELALLADQPAEAASLIEEGRRRYPTELRFATVGARIDLFHDRFAAARARLDALPPAQADQIEALLVRGELERLSGHGIQARNAFRRATELAPHDGRGWLGLARVESERDALGAARHAIDEAAARQEAVSLSAGRLAADNDRLTEARQHFDAALARDPADYEAWTGLGLSRLKAGDEQGALEALLRANVIEPRYAAAVSYSAVAYHRQGRSEVALATLERAAELDPRDPLPYFLRAAILRELGRPAEALSAAQGAQSRLPYLKSLNRLATDRQGSLALGATPADLGLEAWAESLAQESALPGWAGSHLFLAERLGRGFSHDSELMQGLLADPTVFGVAGRRQPLLSRAGDHLSVAGRVTSQDKHDGGEWRLSSQGLRNHSTPWAYLLDWRHHAHPLSLIDGDIDQATVGLGWRPRAQTGLFLYAGGIDGDFQLRSNKEFVDLRQARVDLGWSERFGPHTRWWLKLGDGYQSWQQALGQQNTDNRIDDTDLRWRHDDVFQTVHRLSTGGEWIAQDRNRLLVANQGLISIEHQERSRDKLLWLAWRTEQGPLAIEAQLDWHRLEFNNRNVTRHRNSTSLTSRGLAQRSTLGSRFGLSWHGAGIWRFAWQDWRKPLGSGSLLPTATAGIALDDSTVLPGGRQQRGRLQWEWQDQRRFARLYLERQTIDNLSLDGLNPVLNTRPVAGRDTLLGDWDLPLPDADTLPGQPEFPAGRLERGGIALATLLDQHWSLAADLVGRHSRYRGGHRASLSPDDTLPNMPRRQATLSLSWLDHAWKLSLQGVYRSAYHVPQLDGYFRRTAGWTGNLRATWRSPERAWQLSLFGDELGRSGSRFGVGWEYRF